MLVPEGDKFNSRGQRPRKRHPIDEPCKGFNFFAPAIEFVPVGDQASARLRRQSPASLYAPGNPLEANTRLACFVCLSSWLTIIL